MLDSLRNHALLFTAGMSIDYYRLHFKKQEVLIYRHLFSHNGSEMLGLPVFTRQEKLFNMCHDSHIIGKSKWIIIFLNSSC